ncbi:MAG: DUF2877 domain-containing protein [Proteobacteria bacterium]|nr:DUF2877 domain-containing protein [Pseudomonadota bacterium]
MQALSITATAAPALRRAWPKALRAIGMLHARSADAMLLDRLAAHDLQGRVHSVFERVINIEADDGGLYTLSCSALDDAPRSAVIDVPRLGAECAAVGDAVEARGHRLVVGPRMTVSFASAIAWDAELDDYPAMDATLRANGRRLRKLLAEAGACGGMVADPRRDDRFATAVSALLRQRAEAVCDALVRGDAAEAATHACTLIGLGPGLTPSGDDFLVGLLAVLNVAGSPLQACRAPLAAAVIDSRDATNAISHAALAEAAHGRVRASIAALVGAAMRCTPPALDAAARRVLAIGATSGTDIALGIVSAFEAGLRAACR